MYDLLYKKHNATQKSFRKMGRVIMQHILLFRNYLEMGEWYNSAQSIFVMKMYGYSRDVEHNIFF